MHLNIRSLLKIRRFLGIIFLCSLTFFLWLGDINFTYKTTVIGQKVNAQATNQLVEEGVERYQSGDLTGAIALWEKALKEKIKKPSDEVVVRENLARTYYQTGKMQESLNNWEKAIAYYQRVGNRKMWGRSKTEQAQVYNSVGQPDDALRLLCNPNLKGDCVGDSAVVIARSIKDLGGVEDAGDLEGEVAALGVLGDTLRLRGDYEAAVNRLQEGLDLAQKRGNRPQLIAAINHSLGNARSSLASLNYSRADLAGEGADRNEVSSFLDEAKTQDENAIASLQTSFQIANKLNNYQQQIQVLQTLIPIYYRNDQANLGNENLQAAISLLDRLPENRIRAYAAIDLARILSQIKDGELVGKFQCVGSQNSNQAETLLNQAVAIALKIGDYRAESFARGQLGHLYECRGNFAKAQELTTQARFAAEQGLKAPDSLYLWEWQAGRIFRQKGDISAAINSYEKALDTLENIRQDILRANRDIQFDFRDTIEPIYRDLVEMRLSLEPPVGQNSISNKSLVSQNNQSNNQAKDNNFDKVINTIDSLRLAELQNFFGNNCNINDFIRVDLRETDNQTEEKPLVDTVISDNQTAVISTIILEDRVATILSLRDQEDKYDLHSVSREQLTEEVNQFRRVLQRGRDDFDRELGKKIYNWMIAPFKDELNPEKIKKLVFIHDGILRSVPMAALHDGEKFLIEKYAIATTPSLRLTDTNPLNRDNLRVLALGLSEKSKANGRDWSALINVKDEIKRVIDTIPGKKLLNDKLTEDNLTQALKEEVYSILHVATHGTFGTDPQNTFIVMGEKNDQTQENKILNFNELDQIIRQISRNREPLEMLTLTACETAVGNNRSALGLAGIAIQAGAKTAIASLWPVSDDIAAIFANQFYQQLIDNPEMSKADALKAVQTDFIQGKIAGEEGQRPDEWSSFILIGNWN